jgi:hypothetical protein
LRLNKTADDQNKGKGISVVVSCDFFFSPSDLLSLKRRGVLKPWAFIHLLPRVINRAGFSILEFSSFCFGLLILL